jgi:hypothetical protein
MVNGRGSCSFCHILRIAKIELTPSYLYSESFKPIA